MKKFKVALWYTVYNSYEIDADSEEEAIEQAHQKMHDEFENTNFNDIDYSEPYVEEIENN